MRSSGLHRRLALKKANLLRVPPEVELEGLDAEFQQDFYPEFERVPETVVLPSGEEVGRSRSSSTHSHRQTDTEPASRRGGGQAVIDSFPYDAWDEVTTTFWTSAQNSNGTYVLTALGVALMVLAHNLLGVENKKLSTQAALLRGAGGLPQRARLPGPVFQEPLSGLRPIRDH